MSREYIADKDTLDVVNNKVGTSGDAESSTPTTLFAGIKYAIKGILELKNLLSDGKTLVANAITGKGVATAANAAFATMATNIGKISTLAADTSDANATAAQILKDKTAYVKGVKVTGTIPSKAAATITPGTTDQVIAAGQYLAGKQTIKGSANLKAENIKQGVDIMGVIGSCMEKTVPTKIYAESGRDGTYDIGFIPSVIFISNNANVQDFTLYYNGKRGFYTSNMFLAFSDCKLNTRYLIAYDGDGYVTFSNNYQKITIDGTENKSMKHYIYAM